MLDSSNSSNDQQLSTHGRRDFLSLATLAGGGLLLAAETRGQTPVSNSDDLVIAKTVGLADSITLYANLLEDARRLILQKDAYLIHVAKFEATEWLALTTREARRLRSLLTGVELTAQQKSALRTFLSDVESGGTDISEGLIRMRREPLEEIKNLDADFDGIRATLTVASNALKDKKIKLAKENIALAISKLNKYRAFANPVQNYAGPALTGPALTGTALTGNAPTGNAYPQPIGQPAELPPSTLAVLLRAVLDLLDSAPQSYQQHHSTATKGAVSYPILVAPALQTSINAVLRNRLKPATWLRVGIAYALAFPILLRVSDKNNRLKLLNDALRVVPPGLRNPELEELAKDLANLP